MTGSLTLALDTAKSGLMASQQALAATANNISNVNTDGYSRKVVKFETRTVDGIGAGVQVGELRRMIDENLVYDMRRETGELSDLSVQNDFYQRMQDMFGEPADNSSLSHTINKLATAFEELAMEPDKVLQQSSVADRGQDISLQMDSMTTTIQNLRLEADHEIADAIDRINEYTTDIASLNNKIVREEAIDGDTSTLRDQRDQALNGLAELLDIDYYSRGDGDLVVFTKSGVSLVDNSARALTFTEASALGPSATYGEGDLSGITIDDGHQQVDITNRIGGGSVRGLVDMRDDILPGLQSELDELAGELMRGINAQHNRGAGFPGMQSMDGTRRFLDPDAQQIALGDNSDVRLTLMDNDGKQVATTTLNTIMTDVNYGTNTQTSHGLWDVSEVATTIEDWVQEQGNANAAVTFDDDNRMTIELNDTTLNLAFRDEYAATGQSSVEGAEAQDATIKFNSDGATIPTGGTLDDTINETISGFSSFFGLNDFYVTDLGDNIHDSDVQQVNYLFGESRRLYFSDNPNVGGGSGMSSFSDPTGGMGYVDIPQNSTLEEMAAAINTSANVSNVTASVIQDGDGVRLRLAHDNGLAFTITEGNTDDTPLASGENSLLAAIGMHVSDVRRASDTTVRSDIQSQPSNMSRGMVQWNDDTKEYFLGEGDNAIAEAMADVMKSDTDFEKAGGLPNLDSSYAEYAASILAHNASSATTVETRYEQKSSLTTALSEQAQSSQGVNLDEEMSNLIVFEQSYAASARVISVISEMFDSLEAIA